MALFPLSNRKQIPVTACGADFIVYEPSALDRCEYFRLGSEGLANAPAQLTIADDSSAKELGEFHAARWCFSKLNREQTAFLVASCLKPGLSDTTLETVFDEVKTFPDELLNALSDAAFEVAGLILDQEKKA